MSNETLLAEIRDRFAHVDSCPEAGPRVFFENAGGALTLKAAVDASAYHAGVPDNPGRDNEMGRALVDVIGTAKSEAMTLLGASSGQVFVGESGTELIFRMVMNACLGTEPGDVIGSTVEHPATRSASKRWAKVAGHRYLSVPHDNETGTVRAEHYAEVVTPETRVATILHTSPVTGMGMDVPAIVGAIRAVAPSCLVIVDGIQHAAHGDISIDSYGVDGYAISPYKMFSRHGFGVAWISDRLTAVPHDALEDGPEDNWELGTRDAGCYAAFTAVPHYLDWLGSKVSDVSGRRARIEAAAAWIHEHETSLTDVMLHGTGNLQGLADLPGLTIVGGVDNPCREGLVTFAVDGRSSPDVVTELRHHGIRTHTRKADHYSGSVLKPLGLEDAVRVSLCHYNTKAEVAQFLAAMAEILAD